MPIAHDLRRGLIASVLLGAALNCAALTLGRSRGVALIGRPLDVTIAVTLDNAGQAADLCPDADVFHGDSRLDASRVAVTVDSVRGLDAVVRVRSTVAVDEPVMTIYLRLGCTQKVTRRYVLLAEEPSELPAIGATAAAAAPAVTLPSTAIAPRTPTPATAATAAAAAAGARAPVTRARRQAVAAEAAAAPAAAAAAAPAAKAERALSPRQAQRSGNPRATGRLKLDMLDLLPDRDPTLRSTAGLAGEPSTSEQVRAEAAALWRSINAQPQDVLRDLQRVQALETDVKTLHALIAGNERTLNDLRQQVSQARQERTLMLAAVALLTLLLAAIVVTWWLRRGERAGPGQRDWWRRGEPAATDAATAAAAASVTAAAPAREPVRPSKATANPARVADVDLRVDESMFESLKAGSRGAAAAAAATAAMPAVPSSQPSVATPRPTTAPSRMPGAGDPLSTFHSSGFQSSRMVKAEELVDIQQQADFFMSLGQTEQAIDVLESHIRNNVETSALVWLDLLAIYRSLKRRDDYELLRGDFQRVFNAEVPAYDATPTVSGGLEDYPRALSRISALWPSAKVMDVIEESIFRKPGTGEGKPFDLEAYRELVMLYNLGREVVEPEAAAAEDWSESRTSTFYETSMQPLSVSRSGRASGMAPLSVNPEPAEAMDTPFDVDSMLGDMDAPESAAALKRDPRMPRPSPRLGLDIDLSGPAELSSGRPTLVPDFDTDSTVDFELSQPGGDIGDSARKK